MSGQGARPKAPVNGLVRVMADRGLLCTGIAASWCPVCGDCACPRTVDGERIDNEGADDCPLHAASSAHASAEGGAR